jgi:hypothetical protein
LDEIYRATSPSLVWVRRFDGDGKRIDTALGFVIGKERIWTAFQAIDAATKLEIEFSDGRKVETDEITASSRSGDWAIIRADTAGLVALRPGDPSQLTVGARLIVFNVENGAKALGGVDISGKQDVPAFGERIQFSPAITLEATAGRSSIPREQSSEYLEGALSPDRDSTRAEWR